MKTVCDIIEKVNLLRDNRNIPIGEMLQYINDLDCQLMAAVNPTYTDHTVTISDHQAPVAYDLPAGVEIDDIHAVYIDGKRILRRKSLHDTLDGWYCQDGTLYLSPPDIGEEAVIQFFTKTIPHALENIDTDEDLAVPEAFRELYVYHVLAQIASKENDANGYENYKNDFNSCLSQCLTVMRRSQLYPNLAIKE